VFRQLCRPQLIGFLVRIPGLTWIFRDLGRVALGPGITAVSGRRSAWWPGCRAGRAGFHLP